MPDKTRIVIIDDHPLFREGVATILNNEADFEIAGQGASADEAIQLAQSLLPDLIVLDLNMPGNGLKAAGAIAETCPVTLIVVLTVSEADDNILEALKLGARAYVLKGIAGSELVRILRSVLAGESYVPPTLAAGLLMELKEKKVHNQPQANPLDDLTEREHQILELLSAGMSNKEIGQNLFLSEKTVKHYMTNILQKLQVRNRVEAALLAQKRGQNTHE
jgi:two-component system nitrate/nitrite response regulator NarL